MDARPNQLRYERKFLVPRQSWDRVEFRVRLNPGMFSTIFHPRAVNNIYLDSPALRFYFMNTEGEAERTKVRLRWYGDLFGTLSRPVLEFKIKHGLAGEKASFPLKSFLLDEKFNTAALDQVLQKSGLPPEIMRQLRGLEPALINRYQRKYYQSADGNYRITLDSELEFFRVRPGHNAFLCQAAPFPYQVLELKYDLSNGLAAEEIANAFPFRITRMSKYVVGLDRLDGC